MIQPLIRYKLKRDMTCTHLIRATIEGKHYKSNMYTTKALLLRKKKESEKEGYGIEKKLVFIKSSYQEV